MRARGDACTGSITRSTSCAASFPPSTTTRNFPNTKLCRWRKFTSMPWRSCSKVHLTRKTPAPFLQSVTVCCPPLRQRTEPPRPHAQRQRPRLLPAARCRSTSAGCPSGPPLRKVHSPPKLEMSSPLPLHHPPCARPLRNSAVEEKGPHEATGSFPPTPTSVIQTRSRWNFTQVKKMIFQNSSCPAITTSTHFPSELFICRLKNRPVMFCVNQLLLHFLINFLKRNCQFFKTKNVFLSPFYTL